VLELILQGAPLTENACLSAVDQKAVRARLLAFLGSRRIVRPETDIARRRILTFGRKARSCVKRVVTSRADAVPASAGS
jgi:hypothetical protein